MGEAIRRVGVLQTPPLANVTVAGGLVYVSGQVGFDAHGRTVPGGLAAQARQTLTNVKAALESAGSSLDRVIKTTVFLVDAADFAAMNAVYAEFFGAHPPARSTVAVKELMRPDLLIEIEAVALAGS